MCYITFSLTFIKPKFTRIALFTIDVLSDCWAQINRSLYNNSVHFSDDSTTSDFVSLLNDATFIKTDTKLSTQISPSFYNKKNFIVRDRPRNFYVHLYLNAILIDDYQYQVAASIFNIFFFQLVFSPTCPTNLRQSIKIVEKGLCIWRYFSARSLDKESLFWHLNILKVYELDTVTFYNF